MRMGLYEPVKNLIRSETDKTEKTEPFIKKLVAGGVSGMIGAGIANPSDLIKVRLQANSHGITSIVEMFKHIIRTDGVSGLYRGVGPTTQRAILLTASQLSSYDWSKNTLIRLGYLHEGILAHFAASMYAGLVCATVSAPIVHWVTQDLVKSRYMNQEFSNGKGVLYKSTADCFAKTIRNEGAMALFKGWVPQWVRLGPHTIITFIVLEQLRRLANINPV